VAFLGLWHGPISWPRAEVPLRQTVECLFAAFHSLSSQSGLSIRAMDWGPACWKEVGGGILINFEGFSSRGASRVLAHSEVAAWHLPQRHACSSFWMVRATADLLPSTSMAGSIGLQLPNPSKQAVRKSIVLVVIRACHAGAFSLSGTSVQRDRLITEFLPLGPCPCDRNQSFFLH